MGSLFLLAEKITESLKSVLSHNREQLGIFNFEKAIISNSAFEISFISTNISIIVSLNTHHLEIPWCIQVYVDTKNEKIHLNNLKKEIEEGEVVYEVFPNLLQNTNNLGLELAQEIANDILKYLRTISHN